MKETLFLYFWMNWRLCFSKKFLKSTIEVKALSVIKINVRETKFSKIALFCYFYSVRLNKALLFDLQIYFIELQKKSYLYVIFNMEKFRMFCKKKHEKYDSLVT